MSRITIPHPTDPSVHADVGLDHAIGWFADVIGRGKCRSYSAIDPGFDRQRPLWGLLVFLAEHGFYGVEDLKSALERVQHEAPEELPPELRRVVGREAGGPMNLVPRTAPISIPRSHPRGYGHT